MPGQDCKSPTLHFSHRVGIEVESPQPRSQSGRGLGTDSPTIRHALTLEFRYFLLANGTRQKKKEIQTINYLNFPI